MSDEVKMIRDELRRARQFRRCEAAASARAEDGPAPWVFIGVTIAAISTVAIAAARGDRVWLCVSLVLCLLLLLLLASWWWRAGVRAGIDHANRLGSRPPVDEEGTGQA